MNDREVKQRGRNRGLEQTNRDFQMKVGREQRRKQIMIWKHCVSVCVCVRARVYRKCTKHMDES